MMILLPKIQNIHLIIHILQVKPQVIIWFFIHKYIPSTSYSDKLLNNYGPNQHREKLIPKVIYNALNNKLYAFMEKEIISVIGYVDDHCDTLIEIIKSTTEHSHFNIGGEHELKNIDLIHQICDTLSKKMNSISDYKSLSDL